MLGRIRKRLFTTMVKMGWNKVKLGKMLRKIDDNTLLLFEENYNLVDQVKTIVLSGSSDLQPNTDIFSVLVSHGMRVPIARRYSKMMRPLVSHYGQKIIVEMVIEHALGMHAPVQKHPGSKYYYPDLDGDEWNAVENTTVKHCNSDLTATNMAERVTQLVASHPNKQVFYHATSWNAALAILDSGVAHFMGRKCLDFGAGPSFYATPDMQAAIQWAEKKRDYWDKQTAIMVFCVDYHHHHRDNVNKKMFESANTKWRDLVTASRRCVINELDRCDFVYGPMAANVSEIAQKNAKPHKPPKYQLACKGTKADDIMTHALKGIFWLPA